MEGELNEFRAEMGKQKAIGFYADKIREAYQINDVPNADLFVAVGIPRDIADYLVKDLKITYNKLDKNWKANEE